VFSHTSKHQKYECKFKDEPIDDLELDDAAAECIILLAHEPSEPELNHKMGYPDIRSTERTDEPGEPRKEGEQLLRGDLIERELSVGDAVETGILLGPLACKNRCYFSQLKWEEHIRGRWSNLPFKNFLLAYFLKNASWTTGRAR